MIYQLWWGLKWLAKCDAWWPHRAGPSPRKLIIASRTQSLALVSIEHDARIDGM